ncbi:MAG: hypothetical protein ACI4TY_03505, partial [Candidatus Limosilactobacillus intestinavium]
MKKIKLAIAAIITLFTITLAQNLNSTNIVHAAQKTIQIIRYNSQVNEAVWDDKNGNYWNNKKDLVKANAVLKYYGKLRQIKG